MKIQLDTDNKTVKIEQDFNLGEFYDLLQKLLPNDLWREFKLEVQVINNFNSPIIIKEYIPSNPLFPQQPIVPSYPNYPTWPNPNYPWIITCNANEQNNNYTLRSGKFNIQVV